jgi:hypothetical protein
MVEDINANAWTTAERRSRRITTLSIAQSSIAREQTRTGRLCVARLRRWLSSRRSTSLIVASFNAVLAPLLAALGARRGAIHVNLWGRDRPSGGTARQIDVELLDAIVASHLDGDFAWLDSLDQSHELAR